ncbi:hypothetical protein PMAYCL1PPCAC_06420, partial [Pristionchus mayeri]
IAAMLRLLFVSYALVAAASAACTTDQMNTIGSCYAAYNKAYGINDQPPLGPDYFEDFHRQRENMLAADSIAAKPAIAQYGVSLTECLKPVADCIVDSTYEQPPLSCSPGGDGHRFNLDRIQTAYQSYDPAYSIQIRHYYCIDHFKTILHSDDATDPNKDKLNQCNDDLDAALAGTPTDECKAYEANAQCYGQVYSDVCAADEVYEYYCTVVSLDYTLTLQGCTINCKKP